jgi:hypothetical protein
MTTLTNPIVQFCNAAASKKLRTMIGYGVSAEHKFTDAEIRSDTELLSEYADSALGITNDNNEKYEPLRAFVALISSLRSQRIFVNIAELGYMVDHNDMSYTYLAAYMPSEYAASFNEYAGTDEEMFVYICDAHAEVAMWKTEKDDPIGKYGSEKRNPKIVSRDNSAAYTNVMFVRYPVDELKLAVERGGLTADHFESLTRDYVWVQIRPRIFGEKVMHVIAFMRGFMALLAKK